MTARWAELLNRFLYTLRREVVRNSGVRAWNPRDVEFLYALRREVVHNFEYLGVSGVGTGFYTPFGVRWFVTRGRDQGNPRAGFYTPFGVRWFVTCGCG